DPVETATEEAAPEGGAEHRGGQVVEDRRLAQHVRRQVGGVHVDVPDVDQSVLVGVGVTGGALGGVALVAGVGVAAADGVAENRNRGVVEQARLAQDVRRQVVEAEVHVADVDESVLVGVGVTGGALGGAALAAGVGVAAAG